MKTVRHIPGRFHQFFAQFPAFDFFAYQMVGREAGNQFPYQHAARARILFFFVFVIHTVLLSDVKPSLQFASGPSVANNQRAKEQKDGYRKRKSTDKCFRHNIEPS